MGPILSVSVRYSMRFLHLTHLLHGAACPRSPQGTGCPASRLSRYQPSRRAVLVPSKNCRFSHTPSNLVVAHWPSEVESTAPLDFLLRHGLWTPFGYPMSCKIRSIISATCDFTTKSDGIW